MGREDQIEEREVLESIFPDEITGKLPVHRKASVDLQDYSKRDALTGKPVSPRHYRHNRNRVPHINNP